MADEGDAGAGDEVSHDPSAFEMLERDFQEVRCSRLARPLVAGPTARMSTCALTPAMPVLVSQVLGSVMSDKSLDKFRQEYEKLHQALKKVRCLSVRRSA
jgi:hypothetical protein